MDPRRGPLAIYLDKAGLTPLDDRAEDESMRWGRLLETAIADEFEQRRGLFVNGRQLQVVHERLPWLRATVDGFVFDSPDEEAKPIALLETKTASMRSGDWIAENGELQLPEHIEVQVTHQLAVTGFDHAFVAVLLMAPTPRLKVLEVERDEKAIQVLLEIEAAFWDRVQRRDPPSADGYEETAKALRIAFAETWRGRRIEMTDEALQLVDERNRWRKQEQIACDRKREAENALMLFLGENEVGVRDNRVICTWSRIETKRVDMDALRAKHPKLVEKFTTLQPSRRFTFKTKSILQEGRDEQAS